MTKMIMCGLSMEMEMAEEMGTVGKCISCLYLDSRMIGDESVDWCSKHNALLAERESDCNDWVVDHR